jgi:hypothetical protein
MVSSVPPPAPATDSDSDSGSDTHTCTCASNNNSSGSAVAGSTIGSDTGSGRQTDNKQTKHWRLRVQRPHWWLRVHVAAVPVCSGSWVCVQQQLGVRVCQWPCWWLRVAAVVLVLSLVRGQRRECSVWRPQLFFFVVWCGGLRPSLSGWNPAWNLRPPCYCNPFKNDQ